jgi:hypothetical protein
MLIVLAEMDNHKCTHISRPAPQPTRCGHGRRQLLLEKQLLEACESCVKTDSKIPGTQRRMFPAIIAAPRSPDLRHTEKRRRHLCYCGNE